MGLYFFPRYTLYRFQQCPYTNRTATNYCRQNIPIMIPATGLLCTVIKKYTSVPMSATHVHTSINKLIFVNHLLAIAACPHRVTVPQNEVSVSCTTTAGPPAVARNVAVGLFRRSMGLMTHRRANDRVMRPKTMAPMPTDHTMIMILSAVLSTHTLDERSPEKRPADYGMSMLPLGSSYALSDASMLMPGGGAG